MAGRSNRLHTQPPAQAFSAWLQNSPNPWTLTLHHSCSSVWMLNLTPDKLPVKWKHFHFSSVLTLPGDLPGGCSLRCWCLDPNESLQKQGIPPQLSSITQTPTARTSSVRYTDTRHLEPSSPLYYTATYKTTLQSCECSSGEPACRPGSMSRSYKQLQNPVASAPKATHWWPCW